MLDHLTTQLTQLRIWVELLFTAAVAYAIYRMGRALLLWVDGLARQRGVTPLAPWLKWVWRLGVVVGWVAVVTNILNLPQLDVLYELGRRILRAFQASAGQLLVIGALVAIAWPLVGVLTSHIAAGEERSRDAVRLQTLRGVIESALCWLSWRCWQACRRWASTPPVCWPGSRCSVWRCPSAHRIWCGTC